MNQTVVKSMGAAGKDTRTSDGYPASAMHMVKKNLEGVIIY